MRTNQSILIYLLLLFTVTAGNAQLKIEGTVVNALTENPIPFAAVGVKNKSIGTVCDKDGRFAFTDPKDSIKQKEKPNI